MKKLFSLFTIYGMFSIVIFLFLFGRDLNSQTINGTTYPFTTSTGVSLDDMSSGTTLLVGANVDDAQSSLVPIGFDFWFNGVRTSTFSVNSNGLMRVGAASGTGFSNAFASALSGFIMPYWDDMWTGTNGKVHSKVTGSAPNRKLVVEWLNQQIPRVGSGNTGAGTFQVWIYETTGAIEIVYGNGMVLNSVNSGASIGIANSATVFASITTTSGTVSYVTANNTNTGAITSGTKYTFTPIIPATPSALNFTSVTSSGMTLNWTDNSSNEIGFAIYRSDDGGTTYNFINQTAANTITSAQTGLGSGVTYFWKVYAVTEGGLSSELSGSQATLAGTLCGTYSVGPTGNYASLTAAFSDIVTNGMCGAIILELQGTYLSTVETFPLAINGTLPTSAANTLTIRPQTGATGRTITSAVNTINLNGARYVIIDGRPGGTGTSELTISSTSTSAPAIQYINDARNNTLQYCTVTGVITTAGTSGVILFSTTTGTFGNSNNTITNCSLRDGATTPANLICSNGTNDYPNKYNTISNNSLFNWFLATTTTQTGAINLVAGCSDWTISGNSFYQTTSRTFTSSGIVSAISINNTTNSTNYTISNNFIGGTAPNCGGTPLTWTATTGTPIYRLLYISIGSSGVNTISGNTIQNIAMTSASTSTAQSIISHLNGHINITGNTIGSQSGTGSITFTNSGTSTGPILYGFLTGNGANVSNVNISSNTIGGITLSTSSTGTVAFRIMYSQAVQGSAVTMNNNTIGGTVANSITQNTNNTVFGILLLSTRTGDIVTNNTLRNITHTNTGVTGNITGINVQSSGGAHTITGNTVHTLTVNCTNVATNNAASLVGLTMTGSLVGGTNVSNNTIYNLVNLNTTVAGNVTGMYFGTNASVQTTISSNFIHSLRSASGTGVLNGIFIPNTGIAMIYNNMVRLGIDASGNSITNSVSIYGIRKSSSANVGVYFNTVYIGGSSVVSGTVNTYAFLKSTSGSADTVLNNIFYNARTNSTGTGKHYNISLNLSTAIYSNNNAYNGGTVFGVVGVTDYADFNAWKSGTGLDAGSAYGDPQLLNPTGNSSVVDLHISPVLPTIVEATGFNLTQITVDFDGQTRSGLTPVDIGADAGNFVPNDLTPPTISYTLLTNTSSTSNRAFINVTITDASGVNVDPGTMPRVYYKRTTDANEWNDNTSSSNGWKYAEANGGSSPFDFTIDYTLLNGGGGVSFGDVVQYLVVAQDLAGTPNVGINSGTFANPQLSVNLDASAFPIGGSINSYIIVGAPLSGTYTVGLSMMRPLTGRNLEFAAKTRKIKKIVPVENDKPIFTEPKKGEERIAEQFTTLCSVDLTGVTMREIEVEETYYELQENGVKYEGPMYAEYNNRPGTLSNTNKNENSGYTGDAVGNYATITEAVTDLNNRGVSGAVTFLLIDNGNYAGETYPIQFNSNISGISAVNNVTLRPQTSITSTIPGNVNSNATIRILSNYVTIDGSNSGGTDRSLTIQNNSATGPGVVLVGSTGTTPITNVIVKNCILTNGANTSSAVVIGDGTTIGSAGYFNTVTIQNNQIERAYIGVYATGGASAANGFNLLVSDNTLTTSGANSIRLVGLYAQYVNGLTFSGNSISSIANTTDAASLGGIWTASGCSNVTISGNNIGTISSTANSSSNIDFGIYITTGVLNGTYNVTGNTISNIFTGSTATTSGIAVTGTTSGVTIQKNKISNIKNSNTTGYGANGIYLGSTAATGIQTIQNNMIFDIAAYGYGSGTAVSDNGYGIIITAGTNQRVYNNTILLNTSQTVNGLPACLNITSGVTTASGTDVRNNILVNTQTIGTNRYAIYSGAANTVYSNIDYNCYYTSGPNIGYITATNRAAISDWRTGTGKDVQSFSKSPLFASGTDLHIQTDFLDVSGRGNFIATVTDDFDGDSRPTSQSTSVKPVDVGCDQYSASPFATGNVTVLSGSTYFDGGLRAIEITGSGTFTTTEIRQFTGVRTPNNTLLKNNNPVNDSKEKSAPVKKSNVKKQGTSGGQTDAMAVNTPWIYWEIDNLIPGVEPISLRFYYNEDQLATIPEADLKLSYWNGSAWDNSFTQSVNLSGNYIELTLPTGLAWGTTALFSIEDGGAPLPVVMSRFDMAVSNRDISLNWATETEINNKGFSIERRVKTPDNQYSVWKEVSFINGKGNSASRIEYSYTDKKLNSGAYQYRLKQVDYNGNYEYHSPANNSDMVIGKPGSFDISQNYPNPSNPKSKIDFSMPFDGKVSIKVYDILGKEVASLINEFKPADFYTVEFDGSNVSSGTYFYRIIAEGNNQKFTKTMKMILVK